MGKGDESGVRLSICIIGILPSTGAMARKPRLEFFGAFYHVICRGNQRQVIFRSDANREYYLERLEHYRRPPTTPPGAQHSDASKSSGMCKFS